MIDWHSSHWSWVRFLGEVGLSHSIPSSLCTQDLNTHTHIFFNINIQCFFFQVNWETYKKAVKVSMFNAIVVSAIFQHITYPLVVWRDLDYGLVLPSFTTTLWHLFIFMIVVEVGFYYSHRYIHPCVHTCGSEHSLCLVQTSLCVHLHVHKHKTDSNCRCTTKKKSLKANGHAWI